MYNLVILTTGIIGRSYYQPGQVIDVIIDLVAFHRGFFAFKICPQNNPKKTVKASCFDQYPLQTVNGNKFYRDVLSLCQRKWYRDWVIKNYTDPKNMQLIKKSPILTPNHYEIWPTCATYELLILTKFHNDWVKIFTFSAYPYSILIHLA